MTFILKERLHWREEDLDVKVEKGRGFERAEDWKILCNDWPYGLDERIVHLVVWTKFELADDEKGMLSVGAREMIESFVKEKFINFMGEENVSFVSSFHILFS